jgi:antitoxin Phd
MSSQTGHTSGFLARSTKKPNRGIASLPTASQNAAGESWQIQSAKARFSEVFWRARTDGPQRITPQGKEGVVMMAEEHYERLVGKSHQPKNLVEFFRQSPLVGVELDLERDRDPGRDLELAGYATRGEYVEADL